MRRITLLVALLAATFAQAQAPTTFKEGVMAFEKKEWANAERLMRETIAGNPNESEGTVQIAGAWYETYVPHYFLARALARQGKCAEALKHFAESERQGVTPAIPDFARHLNTRGGCKPAAKAAPKQKEIDAFEVPFEDVPVTPKKKDVVVAPKPDPVAPKPDVVPPKPTSDPVKPPQPSREQIEMRARLSAAVNAYLRGEYELATRMLNDPFADRTAAAEAALFRAASRHALYRIGGEKDATLRAQLKRDLAQYRSLRPGARPDARMFPPSFVALAASGQ
jgi:hypothetical protein